MDGLSAVASIIAVLQLTGVVIGYLSDVKDAPKECQQCTVEASNIQSLLINLRYRLEQDQSDLPWFTAVRALTRQKGPLDQYKYALEQLQSKVEIQDGAQKLKKRLLWKFRKEEVASILGRMERLKGLVIIALEMDHFKLSKAIKAQLHSLDSSSQAIQADTTFLRDALPNLETNIHTIRETQHLQLSDEKLKQLQVVLDWVSPTDFPAQQHDIISRRQEGTGHWLLHSPEFEGWLQGAHRTLFCPGIPGAGKTMMAAIIIYHVGKLAQAGDALAYVFCNNKSQVDQNLHGLLSALLKQLAQSGGDIAVPVTRLYDQCSGKNRRPSLDELFTALLSACSNHARVHIVVDALDECTDQDRTRSQLIKNLQKLQAKANVRLLFTSRFIPEIVEQFSSDTVLEVRASDEDVKRYVAGQIPRLPKCIIRNNELILMVQSKIVEAVDGMFLLARLFVDSLLDKRTKHKVLSTLEKLSQGTAKLDEAYGDAIERIDGQLPEDQLLARRTISWLSHARRPLLIQELCHALAVTPGDRDLNDGNINDVEDIISVCAGLVTIDEESNIIRLVHYTTQEYFEKYFEDIGSKWNPGALEEIASNCLIYLSFDTFRSGSCPSDEDFEKRLEEYSFLEYAALHWAEHVRPVETIVSVSEQALAFLQDDGLLSCCSQVESLWGSKGQQGCSEKFSKASPGLHVLAKVGLVWLSRLLLIEHRAEVNTKNDKGETPLLLAAENGHLAVIRLLIEHQAEVDSKADYSRTPLSYAAKNGHQAVVQLLIEHQAIVNSEDGIGRTPLSHAAGNGHQAIVQLLIAYEAEVNLQDFNDHTPLWWAAFGGHSSVVRILLEYQADVNPKDIKGRTPLSWASRIKHEGIIRLLLEYQAEVNVKDNEGQTPLYWASMLGHEGVVRLLLDHQAEVDSKDYDGRTPLWWASRYGHESVVQLLLEYQAEVNFKDNEGYTPLCWASRTGHEGIVRLLLEYQAEVNSKDHKSQTPLCWAVRNRHKSVMRILLKYQADVNSMDNQRHTPLCWAVSRKNASLVRLLLDYQADVNSKDYEGQTPLFWAARDGYICIVRLLLKYQAEVKLKDKKGRKPLWFATKNGHMAVAKLLRTTGN